MATLIGTSEGIAVGAGMGVCSGYVDTFARVTSPTSYWVPGAVAPISPASSGLVEYIDTTNSSAHGATYQCDGSSLAVVSGGTSQFYGFHVVTPLWPWASNGPFTISMLVQSSSVGASSSPLFGLTNGDPNIGDGWGSCLVQMNTAGSGQLTVFDGNGGSSTATLTSWLASTWYIVTWNVQPGVLMRLVAYQNGSSQPAWQVTRSLAGQALQGSSYLSFGANPTFSATARLGYVYAARG